MKRHPAILTFAGIALFFATPLAAQGFLPPASSTPTKTDVSVGPLSINEVTSRSLWVIDDLGQHRSLISYKSYLEDLVIIFFSPRCAIASGDWAHLRNLNDRYKDWHVSFVAVNTSAAEMLPELQDELKRHHIPWVLAQDVRRAAASLYNVTGTPEIVILDEESSLRYRGPLDKAPAALDVIIGHVDSVKQPEPEFHPQCTL